MSCRQRLMDSLMYPPTRLTWLLTRLVVSRSHNGKGTGLQSGVVLWWSTKAKEESTSSHVASTGRLEKVTVSVMGLRNALIFPCWIGYQNTCRNYEMVMHNMFGFWWYIDKFSPAWIIYHYRELIFYVNVLCKILRHSKIIWEREFKVRLDLTGCPLAPMFNCGVISYTKRSFNAR